MVMPYPEVPHIGLVAGGVSWFELMWATANRDIERYTIVLLAQGGIPIP
jgi:hypothetical protein